MMYTGCSAPAWHGSDAGWTYGACLQAPSFTGGYTVWLCSSPDRTEMWSWPGGSSGLALPFGGGIQVVLLRLCTALTLAGHAVRVCRPRRLAYRRIYGVAWLRCHCRRRC
nr:uncharacterized protein LOC127345869 [Lolium perenne]